MPSSSCVLLPTASPNSCKSALTPSTNEPNTTEDLDCISSTDEASFTFAAINLPIMPTAATPSAALTAVPIFEKLDCTLFELALVCRSRRCKSRLMPLISDSMRTNRVSTVVAISLGITPSIPQDHSFLMGAASHQNENLQNLRLRRRTLGSSYPRKLVGSCPSFQGPFASIAPTEAHLH